METLIRIVVNILGAVTVIQLAGYFVSDVCGNASYKFDGTCTALTKLPGHLFDTILFQLPSMLVKLVGFTVKAIVYFVLCVVDAFIQAIWRMIPVLGKYVKLPRLSKLISF